MAPDGCCGQDLDHHHGGRHDHHRDDHTDDHENEQVDLWAAMSESTEGVV